jgi:hypothetical protein
MKIKLTLFLLVLAIAESSQAQWKNNQTMSYTFGSIKNSFERKEEKSIFSISDVKKTGFLPTPSSGASSVFIAGNSSGSFQLNGDESLSSNIGDIGMSRFLVNGIKDATDVLKLSLNLKFDAQATGKGNYTLAIGTDNGKLFTPKTASAVWRSNSEVFTNLLWGFSATSNQINFAYREGSDASKTTTMKTIDRTTFVKGNTYQVDIYCNNSAEDIQKYTVAGTEYTLPSAMFHVWVNDKKIGADFPKSIEVDGDQGLATGTSIALQKGSPLNSFSFTANNGSAESKISGTISKVNLVYAKK